MMAKKTLLIIAFYGIGLWSIMDNASMATTNRVRSNGTLLSKQHIEPSSIVQSKPLRAYSIEQLKGLASRFVNGDKTLTDNEISALYYQYVVPKDSILSREFIRLTDEYIHNREFVKALQCSEGALGTLCTNIPLLNRACDLANHTKSERVDLYVWQLASLFHSINTSGDGKSYDTAFQIKKPQDARLFQTMWIQTPPQEVKKEVHVRHNGTIYIILETQETPYAPIKKIYYRIV